MGIILYVTNTNQCEYFMYIKNYSKFIEVNFYKTKIVS